MTYFDVMENKNKYKETFQIDQYLNMRKRKKSPQNLNWPYFSVVLTKLRFIFCFICNTNMCILLKCSFLAYQHSNIYV